MSRAIAGGAAALAFGLALAACTSSSGTPATDAGPSADGMIGCQTDPLAETYTANMTKPGAMGVYTFDLVQAVPAPPAMGNNTWTLKITDSGANPVPSASLTVKPYMPRHGHPSTVVPTVTPNGDGTYKLDPLYLFMAGLWQVTIDVVDGDGGVIDSVVYTFCVQG